LNIWLQENRSFHLDRIIDVSKILEETQAGKHFSYNDSETVKRFILEKFELWKNGNLSENTHHIEQFSRKNLTKQLTEIL
jgi:hypothetical protein